MNFLVVNNAAILDSFKCCGLRVDYIDYCRYCFICQCGWIQREGFVAGLCNLVIARRDCRSIVGICFTTPLGRLQSVSVSSIFAF